MNLLLRSFALSLTLILTACAKQPVMTASPVNPDELQASQWLLTDVDNQEIHLATGQKAPSVSIDRALMATGYTGCNNYFGTAEIRHNQIRLVKMGSTKKLCFNGQMELETLMTRTLSDWSTVEVNRNVMTLSSQQHTLRFKAGQK